MELLWEKKHEAFLRLGRGGAGHSRIRVEETFFFSWILYTCAAKTVSRQTNFECEIYRVKLKGEQASGDSMDEGTTAEVNSSAI